MRTKLYSSSDINPARRPLAKAQICSETQVGQGVVTVILFQYDIRIPFYSTQFIDVI